MEKQINDQIDELLKESLEEIGVINIQASPFATQVTASINEGYIKKIESFIHADENKIKEIIQKHVSDLGDEISDHIKSCNNKEESMIGALLNALGSTK